MRLIVNGQNRRCALFLYKREKRRKQFCVSGACTVESEASYVVRQVVQAHRGSNLFALEALNTLYFCSVDSASTNKRLERLGRWLLVGVRVGGDMRVPFMMRKCGERQSINASIFTDATRLA